MIKTKLQPEKLKDLKDEKRRKIIKRCETKWSEIIGKITPIINDVKNKGDDALVYYTKKFDKVVLNKNKLQVTRTEIKEAYSNISDKEYDSLLQAKRNIKEFHSRNIPKTWMEKFYSGKANLGKQTVPVDRAGVYVPGGKYNYPSTAMMAIIPAKIAGVQEIVAVTPPKKNGRIPGITLAAMDMAGATKIFKVGGAQAIAALAYGTESIPDVDIIVGPGNIYVNSAKKWLSMTEMIRIDLPAGPSEILVLADNSAKPDWIAKDMISQAAHDENACAILITDSEKIANQTYQKLLEQIYKTTDFNISIARKSLSNYGAILLVDNLYEAVEFSNEFAPEHLEIMIENESKRKEIAGKIKHAGSIFLGECSTVALADYMLGTNHILPTGGAAKRFSALSTETFQKTSMLQEVSPNLDAIKLFRQGVTTISKSENLYNMHGISVEARYKYLIRKKRKKNKV